jgi:tRNA-dihydrouridine synthase 4
MSRDTVDLCQKAEHAGVSWIAIHGRTKEQRCQPVNLEAIATVRESIAIPVIANGDIKSREDADMIKEKTGVHGNMNSENKQHFV